ncbi:MAG: DUF58 domain-containing protein [Acidobacteriota bacterium]
MIPVERAREWIEAGQSVGARHVLATPRGLAAGASGGHLGTGLGSSIEFLDHREYQPGDDLRHVDWSASARGDRLVVKLFREEVTPWLDLVIDGSRSMALPGTAKAEAAIALSALLAEAGMAAGFRHAAWRASDGCERLDAGALSPESFAGDVFRGTCGMAQALAHRPPRLRPRSIRLVVSDLLFPDDPAAVLDRLAPGAALVAMIQIVARADLDPPEEGMLRLHDVETGEELEVSMDAAAARGYRAALEAHRRQWHDATRARAVPLVSLCAEDLLARWELHPVVAAGILAPGT